MKSASLAAAVLLAFLSLWSLTGCHTHIYAGSADLLEGASPKDSAYVKNGHVYIGMDAQYVRAALGPPKVVRHADGNSMRWVYRFQLYGPGGPGYTVAVLDFDEHKNLVGTKDLPGRYMR